MPAKVVKTLEHKNTRPRTTEKIEGSLMSTHIIDTRISVDALERTVAAQERTIAALQAQLASAKKIIAAQEEVIATARGVGKRP